MIKLWLTKVTLNKEKTNKQQEPQLNTVKGPEWDLSCSVTSVEPNRKKKDSFLDKDSAMKAMDSVYRASPVAHMVNNLPAMQETWV